MALKIESALNEVDGKIARALVNAGALVEGSAKAKCPVDTGNLRASIHFQVDGNEAVYVGTNVEYAPYVELGTRYMGAKPFLRPALEENRQNILELFRGII